MLSCLSLLIGWLWCRSRRQQREAAAAAPAVAGQQTLVAPALVAASRATDLVTGMMWGGAPAVAHTLISFLSLWWLVDPVLSWVLTTVWAPVGLMGAGVLRGAWAVAQLIVQPLQPLAAWCAQLPSLEELNAVAAHTPTFCRWSGSSGELLVPPVPRQQLQGWLARTTKHLQQSEAGYVGLVKLALACGSAVAVTAVLQWLQTMLYALTSAGAGALF